MLYAEEMVLWLKKKNNIFFSNLPPCRNRSLLRTVSFVVLNVLNVKEPENMIERTIEKSYHIIEKKRL